MLADDLHTTYLIVLIESIRANRVGVDLIVASFTTLLSLLTLFIALLRPIHPAAIAKSFLMLSLSVSLLLLLFPNVALLLRV